jgi:hypothetical protein
VKTAIKGCKLELKQKMSKDFGEDLLGEFEAQEEDEGLLEEMAEKRKERQKSFISVINKKKLSKFELDEVML